MARSVTPIPATLSRFATDTSKTNGKRRAAGYARVSTERDEQFTSFEAQVDYYSRFIREHKDWEFVDVYTDEGISGTNTKHRQGFNRMIADAKNGRIDLIITKSISRFARNTVDTLTTIRELREKNVECYFEKENIWTFDSQGEVLVTIMSSLAQEESRSMSENIRWAVIKKFEQGKFSLPYKQFLGYDRGKDGEPVVNPEQAEVVKKIYYRFLCGYSPRAIAEELTRDKIPTPSGKSPVWNCSTIQRILQNEKYAGNAVLQKTFTIDFLNKKIVKNNGQMTKFSVTGSHEAIISQEQYDLVQEELKNRTALRSNAYSSTIFTNRIFCGYDGTAFGPKVWHSTDKYRRVIYRCNHKYDGNIPCKTPHLTEEEIKRAFVSAVNRLRINRDDIISSIDLVCSQLFDGTALENRLSETETEIEVLKGMWKKQFSSGPIKDAKPSSSIETRLNEAVAEYESLKSEIATCKNKAVKLRSYSIELRNLEEPVMEFSEHMWSLLLDRLTVFSKEKLVFRFRDESEVLVCL